MAERPDTTREERRRRGLLWLGGLTASAVMILGVNGTLAAWTTAIITNSTNTTKATDSVALQELSLDNTLCADTGTTTDNTATCATINKYGGTATPLAPGGATNSTTVTMKNTGTVAGKLVLTADACTSSGGPIGSTGNICNEVDLTVTCGGAQVFTGTLNGFAAAAPATVASASLAADAWVSCNFAVSLPPDAPSNVADMVASQPLVWTLTAL